MVIYTCPTCGKEFNRKCNFMDHTEKKKNPCQPNPPKFHQVPPVTRQIPPEVHQDPPTAQKNIYSCTYCSLGFTRKDTLKRHMDSRCKVKQLDNEHKEKTFELLIKENEDIKKDNEEIKKDYG